MVPLLVYESGMSFGDLALHKGNRRRGGTIVTLSDCYFAVITAESYEKLIKKDKAIKMANNVKFLRQIPYITDWTVRETQGLYMLCNEKKVELIGTTIINEGDPCDKVLIILKGEVEMMKTNLSTVYFNHETSTIGVKE